MACNPVRRNKCSYYLNKDHYNCWEVEGTFCQSDFPETSSRKLITCAQCDFYVSNVWGLRPSDEHKNHIRGVLDSDITKLAQVSINNIIQEALKEMRLLNADFSERTVFSPDNSVPHIYSSFNQLKDLVGNLVSQALENLPPQGEINITAMGHSGEEIKVVISSAHPELHSARPLNLPDSVRGFEGITDNADSYQWVVTLGKDRRRRNRRERERRAGGNGSSHQENRRTRTDRRQTDRRFIPVA